LSQAIETWKPQVAIISNPTALHMDTALPLARAGIHMLIEKPISNTLGKVLDLQATINETGAKALVGYQFRFHPGLRQTKKMIAENRFGKIHSVHVYWGEYLPDWHPWEEFQQAYSARRDLGGGVVLTLSHPLDYLRWLFGDVEAVVKAEIGKSAVLNLDVEDTADIELDFVSGVQAQVRLDYLQSPKQHWMEIKGENGTLHWDYADANPTWRKLSSQDEQHVGDASAFRRNDMFLQEMTHFIDMVRNDVNPICSLEDGLRALEVAVAVHQSAQEGRRIILKELLQPRI
jgi:predicted dehydrogenase